MKLEQDNKMSCSEKAVQLFEKGYNCSQSVVLAFQNYLKLDEKTLQALSSSFGGGISRLREVCGCVTGMAIVFGLLYGDYDINDVKEKGTHYHLVQQTALKFKEETKSLLCDELLNIKDKPSDPFKCQRDKNYYQKRPCAKYISLMANIMEEVIQNKLSKN